MQGAPGILQNEAYTTLNERSDGNAASRASVDRSDIRLVELVRAGDETAFEEIFDRHKQMVVRLAGRFFREPAEADDILQITFAKAFLELDRFNGKHEYSLAGWLRKIAVNACIDTLRKRKRRPEGSTCALTNTETGSLASNASFAAGADATVTDRQLVNRLLGHLEPNDRAVMLMLYAEEMSVAEIGQVLGWSVSKVKIRAWRARRQLRSLMHKYM